MFALGPYDGAVVPVGLHESVARRLTAALHRHLGEAHIHSLRQLLRQSVYESQLGAVHLLLRRARIRGLVQLLVYLLPVEHHGNAVTNLTGSNPNTLPSACDISL